MRSVEFDRDWACTKGLRLVYDYVWGRMIVLFYGVIFLVIEYFLSEESWTPGTKNFL